MRRGRCRSCRDCRRRSLGVTLRRCAEPAFARWVPADEATPRPTSGRSHWWRRLAQCRDSQAKRLLGLAVPFDRVSPRPLALFVLRPLRHQFILQARMEAVQPVGDDALVAGCSGTRHVDRVYVLEQTADNGDRRVAGGQKVLQSRAQAASVPHGPTAEELLQLPQATGVCSNAGRHHVAMPCSLGLRLLRRGDEFPRLTKFGLRGRPPRLRHLGRRRPHLFLSRAEQLVCSQDICRYPVMVALSAVAPLPRNLKAGDRLLQVTALHTSGLTEARNTPPKNRLHVGLEVLPGARLCMYTRQERELFVQEARAALGFGHLVLHAFEIAATGFGCVPRGAQILHTAAAAGLHVSQAGLQPRDQLTTSERSSVGTASRIVDASETHPVWP
mmetsp:Transcript_42804/g.118249  ORF Transcript_42804/g.118249 Transcript_42804/m.118249 type:complete len:387 (-) Transcript_42804:384-1544(-)